MRISAMEEYGVRCLVTIARSTPGPISAHAISEKEGLSQPYAQKILRSLVTHGFIEATRGANGGYTLARSADQISVGEVMRALGGPVELDEFCERHTGDLCQCIHHGNCSIEPVWSRIADFITRTLDNVTIGLLTHGPGAVTGHLSRVAPIVDEARCPMENRLSQESAS